MILIAIGANLAKHHGGSPLDTCEAAAKTLAELPGLTLLALSRWYESKPYPPSSQPNYVNGVIAMNGNLTPINLLQMLHGIEAIQGRVRSVPNAARTLDLDIIDMHGLVRAQPDPILPHPRAHERSFVLRPLLDVAPLWRHPISGMSGQALLDALPDQAIEAVECSHLRDAPTKPI